MAWSIAAHAQQGDRVRRIGVLTGFEENQPLAKTYLSAFIQALADLGWTDGRNVRIDVRWGRSDHNRTRALAQELVGLQPDIIVASGTPAIVALQRETRTIPIVFVAGGDPFITAHRASIIFAAAQNKVPAIHWQSVFARDGGLLSYGSDDVDIFRRAAAYVDRILRGAKLSELPVQFPTKFELVINMKTAKALGLTIPPNLPSWLLRGCWLCTPHASRA